MPNNKNNKTNKNKNQDLSHVPANATFALAWGDRAEKDPKTGITHPPKDGLEEAKEFINVNQR